MTEELGTYVAASDTYGSWIVYDQSGHLFATCPEFAGYWVPAEARARIIARLLNKNAEITNDEIVIAALSLRVETLEPVAAYGEAILRRDYEDEAGIESILSATRGIKSSHRSYEAFKAERLATLAKEDK